MTILIRNKNKKHCEVPGCFHEPQWVNANNFQYCAKHKIQLGTIDMYGFSYNWKKLKSDVRKHPSKNSKPRTKQKPIVLF